MKYKKLLKRNLLTTAFLSLITVGTVIFLVGSRGTENLKSSLSEASPNQNESLFDIKIESEIPNIKYGFNLDDYEVVESTVKKNEVLSELLAKYNVSYNQIDKLAKASQDVFDVRKMRIGKNYMILSPKGENQTAQYFIYEPSAFRYVVYDLQNDTEVKMVEHPIKTVTKTASGIVYASLWNTMTDNDLDFEVATKMEKALAWSVDFHHIQKNDKFKLIYDEQYIDGKKVGIGEVHAAYFQNKGKDYYAYYYEDDTYKGFFDEEGRPMKTAFLKSPVEYARISSPYNLKRFHPILKRRKAHLGTDYAAPHGTPILAVANGTIERKGYGRGNGNFIKIKHDKVYATQYLHMQKFAKGMKVGKKVKQGDVIGYVGSTGLATGPHVCFRFWKNGKQVNHLKLNLPQPEPMSEEHLALFKQQCNDMKSTLEEIAFQEKETTTDNKQTKSKVDP